MLVYYFMSVEVVFTEVHAFFLTAVMRIYIEIVGLIIELWASQIKIISGVGTI